MNNFHESLILRKSEWIKAMLEHIQISLSSLLLAIFIAVPLSVVISKNKKIRELILHTTGIFQTIPSLAILGLLIPLLGIGVAPAMVALVIYALFPIIQNTITGFLEIDPSLQEAAEAFGMTKMEKLKKFELALAMPVIISGIRTAAVMIIGTATLAALVGAGGLGSFILLGIDRNNSALIFIGALSSAILAVLFNIGIKILERQKIKIVFLSLLSIIIFLLITFIPQMSHNKKLVVAGKLGAEPEIIINMYKLLIEKNMAVEVEVKANFGKTTFLYEALKSGEIDIYPEYTGTVITSLLKEREGMESREAREVFEIAKDKIYKQDSLIYLEPMQFQNTYALALKKDFAEKNKIFSISDLKKIEKNLIAGFTLEFNDREDGNKGLQTLYNLKLNVKTMEPSLRYQAINHGEVQLIDAYSTDSEIKENDLIVLSDDRGLFPPYQVAPLLKENTLIDYPELKIILEKLADKVSDDEMRELNYQVRVKGKAAYEVAEEYLRRNNLLD